LFTNHQKPRHFLEWYSWSMGQTLLKEIKSEEGNGGWAELVGFCLGLRGNKKRTLKRPRQNRFGDVTKMGARPDRIKLVVLVESSWPGGANGEESSGGRRRQRKGARKLLLAEQGNTTFWTPIMFVFSENLTMQKRAANSVRKLWKKPWSGKKEEKGR